MTVTDFKKRVFDEFLLNNDSLPAGEVASVDQF